jgi:2-haloacid dehalogenase
MMAKAVVFDAYGTLLDVHSMVREAGGNLPEGFSTVWRQKQLEYTWLRALMERYEDFWEVTEAALRAACAQLRIEIDEPRIAEWMAAYLRPAAFADARTLLERLKGRRLAILSNGSPRMLEAAIRHNGLERHFEEIISVERVRTYKPAPRVYALGQAALGIPAGEILFVSSNAWDAAGAKAYGYRVCWCNRTGAPMERLGFDPDLTVTSLDEIAGS